MIIRLDVNHIDSSTRLIEEKNKANTNSIMRYYPFDYDQIKSRLTSHLDNKNRAIFVDCKENQVHSLMELLLDIDNNYLQIVAFFTYRKISETLSDYILFIKKEFPGFKLDWVLDRKNENHIRFLKSHNVKTDGYETMLHLRKVDYKPLAS